jgi:hypothetical protein
VPRTSNPKKEERKTAWLATKKTTRVPRPHRQDMRQAPRGAGVRNTSSIKALIAVMNVCLQLFTLACHLLVDAYLKVVISVRFGVRRPGFQQRVSRQ